MYGMVGRESLVITRLGVLGWRDDLERLLVTLLQARWVRYRRLHDEY